MFHKHKTNQARGLREVITFSHTKLPGFKAGTTGFKTEATLAYFDDHLNVSGSELGGCQILELDLWDDTRT